MCEAYNKEFAARVPDLEWNICYLPSSQKVIYQAWLDKLKQSNTSVNECRTRNDILFYLIERTAIGTNYVMPEPFNRAPNEKPITDPIHKFPRSMRENYPRKSDRNLLMEMFKSCPDRGAFLAEQPVPKVGTFGFMVFKKAPKNAEDDFCICKEIPKKC